VTRYPRSSSGRRRLSGGLSLIGAALAFAIAPDSTSLPQGLFDLLRGESHAELSLVAWIFLIIAVLLIGRLLGCLVLTFYTARKARPASRRDPSSAQSSHQRPTLIRASSPPTRWSPTVCPRDRGRARQCCRPVWFKALDEEERKAVIAHERAHLDFRHDILVIPFAAWHQALPYFSATAIGLNSVNRLIELMADDQARQNVDPQILARAVESATAISPDHRSELSAHRVRRLSRPVDTARIPVRLVSIGLAAVLLLVPTLLILIPAAFGI
jgi:hypothetical protein